MAEVTIYGAFDDLIEVEGDFEEEFGATRDHTGQTGRLLAFGDGSIIFVVYTDFGVWRITTYVQGSSEQEKVDAPLDDDSNYSDRLTLRGDLRWVACIEDGTLHKVPEKA